MFHKRCSFVLLAGGRGARMGSPFKQFRPLGGIPLWAWGLRLANRLYSMGLIEEAVVVFPRDIDFTDQIEHLDKFDMPSKIVKGGETRPASSLAGVTASCGDYVLVHDAARPFASVRLVKRIISALTPESGVIPLTPVRDALKRVSGKGDIFPVSRENLWCTQTPQGFPREELIAAMQLAGDNISDEAEAWIKAGHEIKFVEGEPNNIKVTYESDLKFCETIAQGMGQFRVGHGFDVHPLRPWRKLILAGYDIPDAPLGLDGHSDGDVISHAVADALLGAAGEPDLGTLYPASDERYKDASSLIFLQEISRLLSQKNWSLIWLDVTLEAQLPRLSGYIERFKENLEDVLSNLIWNKGKVVNIKVKSGEGVGAVGRARCMRCHCIATMRGDIL
ncbi:MAG: 2-C-methyl-D-erythritol 2,4-cyclodiphosphate synthase [Acetomicrobium flavidum]|uniref:2-C-methyl-D-erythritol 2,4-cyclodiphosphate synthase n=1 Tax=Acetomicrobium flavidum TaxID=49896 RepID=UPI0016960045|nr:2-C-methyl-D-erythritol 2,4-cyclodiphosphate synthase [Acetomicrobium flavidum]